MVSAPPAASRNVIADFEAAYVAAKGRRPHPATLEAMGDILRWLGRSAAREGGTIVRSVPQMVRGVGWPDMGSVQANRDRWKSQLYNRFDMLQEIGWLERYAEMPRKPNGEGTGILLVLTPAGVAQSVGTTPRRPSCETRRRSRVSKNQTFPPPRGDSSVKGRSPGVSSRRQACGRTRDARAHEAPESRRRGQTLLELRSRAASQGGFEALGAAGREGTDPLAVALAGWEQCTPRHPALTARRRMHLQRYCEIADRRGGQAGLGLWFLLGDLERHRQDVADGQIASLDFFVCRLRKEVRRARREERARRIGDGLRALFYPSEVTT